MENDECRMQNGGRKVAISGAPIDAQGCGLSPVLSTELFPAGVTPRETIFCHLPPSVANVCSACGRFRFQTQVLSFAAEVERSLTEGLRGD